MDYETALSIIKRDNLMYLSPDYYRISKSSSIAFAVRDSAESILLDCQMHGDKVSADLFAQCLADGIIIKIQNDDIDADIYKIMDTDNNKFYQRHIALQIAFPKKYLAYWQTQDVDQLIWSIKNATMYNLVTTTLNYLTNPTLINNDFFEPPNDTNNIDNTNNKYSEWVEACQLHKQKINTAWKQYLQMCADKKEKIKIFKIERDDELNKLRKLMTKTSCDYQNKIAKLNDEVLDAKNKHAILKNAEKPNKKDFL